MSPEIKVGDRVYDHGFHGAEGVVTDVAVGESSEDHGLVEVKLKNGIVEHYSHWGWEKFLKRLS